MADDVGPIAAAMSLHYSSAGAEACAMGHHAWVPWLRLSNGSDTTWCARVGCAHAEQYDHEGTTPDG